MVRKQQISGTKRTRTPIPGLVVQGLSEEKLPPLEIAAEEYNPRESDFCRRKRCKEHFEERMVMCYEFRGNGGGFSGQGGEWEMRIQRNGFVKFGKWGLKAFRGDVGKKRVVCVHIHIYICIQEILMSMLNLLFM